jgi:hypothetical protein
VVNAQRLSGFKVFHNHVHAAFRECYFAYDSSLRSFDICQKTPGSLRHLSHSLNTPRRAPRPRFLPPAPRSRLQLSFQNVTHTTTWQTPGEPSSSQVLSNTHPAERDPLTRKPASSDAHCATLLLRACSVRLPLARKPHNRHGKHTYPAERHHKGAAPAHSITRYVFLSFWGKTRNC